jgi:hypothetical protein
MDTNAHEGGGSEEPRIAESGRRGAFARQVERVVPNALATTRGSAAEYLRLPATRLPSSSEKPIHLRKQSVTFLAVASRPLQRHPRRNNLSFLTTEGTQEKEGTYIGLKLAPSPARLALPFAAFPSTR